MSYNVTTNGKPVPSTDLELRREIKPFLRLGPGDDPPPRAKLLSFILSSQGVHRSPNHVSILLAGNSGTGKSTTINHLLNTGKDTKVNYAKINAFESETKKVSEYVLTVDEPKYAVSDLTLGIVDTPGFNDTSCSEQDACTLYAIKKFYKNHPKLR